MVRISSLVAGLLLVLLVGCGGIQKRETVSMERVLSAAGFQMRLADTPAKLTQLEKLPQRRILSQQKDGKPVFLYADATDCKCLYAGTERAYQSFKEIVLRERMTEQAEAGPIDSEDDWLNVDDFGEWGPWW